MNPKLLLCLVLVLSGAWFDKAIAQSMSVTNEWHGFPVLPAITNANPTIRKAIKIHVPARLHVERHADSLVVKADELTITNLTVGQNMITGVACKTQIYQGDKLLNGGTSSLQGGVSDVGYDGTQPFNLPITLQNIPKAGKDEVIVIKLTLFETDMPAQHFWEPQSGKKYKALYEQTFKLPVE
jgi:hypothetical protein